VRSVVSRTNLFGLAHGTCPSSPSGYAGHHAPPFGSCIDVPAFRPLGRATRSPKGEAWWSLSGSNRRPHACKARALPAELRPHDRNTNAMRRIVETTSTHGPSSPSGFAGHASLHEEQGCATRSRRRSVVGLGRLELPTSRLSSARSNQLSYKPPTRGDMLARTGLTPDASRSPWRVFVREERETKTAKSRLWSSTILKPLAPECF
jgi:hypothetical protein